MRILHIINSLGFGGAENLVQKSVPLMCAKGLDVQVLTLQGPDYIPPTPMENSVRLLRTGIPCPYAPRQALSIYNHVKSGNYDLVHVHLFPASYWFAIARHFPASAFPPAVFTEHSTFNKRRRYPVLRPLERRVYRGFARVVCISEAVRESLLEWLPFLEDRVQVIENGIDLGLFQNAEPYRRDTLLPGVGPGSKLILMVANMTPQKDQETLISALATLPSSWHVVLVGDGPLLGHLQEVCRGKRLEDRVHFLGFRSDVPRIMKTVDLFVLSSRWEGFGLVAVEAMASGLPVIASDVEGLSTVIGNAGELFQPGQSAELSALISKVLKDRAIYKSMVLRGHKRAKRFSIEKMVDRYIKAYEVIKRQ